MNIYRISCYSSCGTYFQAYLQSVTVIEHTKKDAVQYLKEWLKVNNKEFLTNDSSKWEVELIGPVVAGVLDWTEDSDY